MILHIPHSSRLIPEELRCQFILSDEELDRELTLLTDAYTDELFQFSGAARVVFAFSRLVVDVERFKSDYEEPMSTVEMGAVYSKTTSGAILRNELSTYDKAALISSYYDSHHELLKKAVDRELQERGKSLIIDCHSFSSVPLPCDKDQSLPRPMVCIGTDDFHTPEPLITRVVEMFSNLRYRIGLNKPFSGAIVPRSKYRKDKKVASIMIEIRRDLYMNELTSAKSSAFINTCYTVSNILRELKLLEATL